MIVALNKSHQDYDAKIEIDKQFNLEKLYAETDTKYTLNGNTLEFTIPGNGFVIQANNTLSY